MKIALVRRTSIAYLDGVNRFIALLAEGLTKLGHEPLIVSWYYRGVEGERLEEWFREIHGLDNTIPIYILHPRPCEGNPWLRIAWDWWTRGSMLLHKEGVDVAIVNGIIPLRFKPKIAVIHDLGSALTLNKFYVEIGRHVLSRYDEIVCVSDKTRRELLSFLRVQCNVIPIPMKLELLGQRDSTRENIIIHIGTRPVKNPQISIEAVRILKERGHNVRLVIIGSPIAPLKVEGVEWRYIIPEKEKLELLRRAKALILPSSYEGFSYVSLEAMACGTPVVVSSACQRKL
jgi:glycosyltransferase involved in cell wall biosynthesis